ncbi:serine hydrolase [Aneurinibacillus migulanus]|uniref:serine hydrolase n=1 Tax=Aneurinibacillus migulanus TaxID=47500 RepID=UPI00137B50AF
MHYKDIVYEIGSLTKVFTTSLLSLLVEKGVVYLDDSIGKYEKNLQIEHPVTLKHLSTHTSGLPSISPIKTIMNRFDKKTYRDPYCLFDVQEAITYLSRVSPGRVGKVLFQ